MQRLRGIGQMARESGLSVSALRFYDGAGVLGPAHVDPHNGYRGYAPGQVAVARLVAALRRVGMPLAGIREVLAVRHDRAAVEALLDAHLQRLEQGLADARRELAAAALLLDPARAGVPGPTTVTVRGGGFAAAVRAVRFAVGSDPALPVLGGVLVEVGDAALTVVATDRYRLAVASVPVLALDGPAVTAVVPAAAADELAAWPADRVELEFGAATIGARAGDRSLTAALLTDRYPDHRRVLPATPRPRPVPVDAAELRAAVEAGRRRTVRREEDGVDVGVTVLALDAEGRLQVDPDHGSGGTGVDAEFLLQALDAGGGGQLLLELDGPVAPLVIRPLGATDTFSLLMPVRLDGPASVP